MTDQYAETRQNLQQRLIAGRVDADYAREVSENLAIGNFTDESGDVDDDKLMAFLDRHGVRRTGSGRRDYGGGRRGPGAEVDDGPGPHGKAEAARRFTQPADATHGANDNRTPVFLSPEAARRYGKR